MSTGILPEHLIWRDRIVFLSAAAGVVIVAWAVLATGGTVAGAELFAPRVHSFGLGGLGATFLMWFVMMVAMMLPPVMPWIMFFAATSRGRDAQTVEYFSTGIFVAGYFVLWFAFSLVAASAQVTVQQLTAPAASGMGTYGAGISLLLAGFYQWTPLKWACLKHCRSPLGFFLARWKNGPVGAFGMGARHGFFCVGCCWALMALSFALGVMNLLWMGVLTLILCIENMAPRGRVLSRAFGAGFAGWGLVLLAGAAV